MNAGNGAAMAKPARPMARRRSRRAMSRRGAGYRHGHRERRLTGSFGTVEIAVPRARINGADGGTAEWKSKALPRYARMTKQVEALIAGTYLAPAPIPGGCAGRPGHPPLHPPSART